MNLKVTTKRTGLHLSFGLVAMLLGVGVCSATPITYNVNQTIGLGSVTGTIQTDGTTGVLGAPNIIGWNLALNGVGASLNLTNFNSSVFVNGTDVTATATNLFFNFGAANDGYLLFEVIFGAGARYYCDAATLQNFVCAHGSSVVPQTIFDPSAQFVPQTGNQIIGVAGSISSVPEPATLSLLALGLVGLGVARRRSAS